MATKEELQQKISALKQQIKDARGTPCEVFSRVVGYYIKPLSLSS